MAELKEQPKVNDVTAPSITKHVSGITGQPDAPSTDVDAATSPSKEAKLVSNVAQKIAPLDTTLQANGEQKVEESPTAVPATTEPEASVLPEETVKEEAPTPHTPTSPYEASDSLPDLSEKMTTELTNDMDSPRIYDTKEYIVPIKDTMHSHGTVGKIMAGIISALVVVGAIVAAAYYLV